MAATKTASQRQKTIWVWLRTLVLVVAVVFALRTFVAEAFVVEGASMLPTFHESDRVLISKLVSVESLERRDIIAFKRDGKQLIKRVIAVGGDYVEIKAGLVFVNDIPQQESYALLDSFTGHRMRVPLGQLFVLGDHRKSSKDSRSWGCVRGEALLGEAILRFYPISSWTVY